jgi:hypothetical protein
MNIGKWSGIGIVAVVCACGGSSTKSPAGDTGIGASPALDITVRGGGKVTSPDGSINCSASCTQVSTVGAAVHLDATPAAGMQFLGWNGACSGTAGCDLTISGDTQVSAIFAAPGAVLLQVDPVGAGGGVVTSSPSGLSCPGTCGMQIAPGSVVTLVATANTGSHFEGFGGSACSGLICTFKIAADATVYANFSTVTPTAILHKLTVTAATGGAVVSTPAGITCPGTCSASFQEGSKVGLAATAASGFTFTGWNGACTGADDCVVTLDGDSAVKAQFTAADPCAGLLPALPAPQTFTIPATSKAAAFCGQGTSDGLGNLYVFDNSGNVANSAGTVFANVSLVSPLASGISAYQTPLGAASTTYAAYAPDGAFVASFVIGDLGFENSQANGGTVITSGCHQTADYEVRRFDDANALQSDVHLANQACLIDGAGAVLVDAQNRTLLVSGHLVDPSIPDGHVGARWFDVAGQPLTEWFDAGLDSEHGITPRPLIGGGAALLLASGWTAVTSGKAEIAPAPAGFNPNEDVLVVLGGKAYATLPFVAVPGTGTTGSIQIVEPGGKVCGTLTATTSTDRFSIGEDGTLVNLSGGGNTNCAATYYPQVLK